MTPDDQGTFHSDDLGTFLDNVDTERREEPCQLAGGLLWLGQSQTDDLVAYRLGRAVQKCRRFDACGSSPFSPSSWYCWYHRQKLLRGTSSSARVRPTVRAECSIRSMTSRFSAGNRRIFCPTAVPCPASFFEYAVLRRRLGHQLLQLLKLRPHVVHPPAVRPGPLSRLQEVLAPTLVEVRRDPLPAAQGSNAGLRPASPSMKIRLLGHSAYRFAILVPRSVS
ncbi:MAG: hypothetical protein WC935_07260 [Thermoleophilia bacterium]